MQYLKSTALFLILAIFSMAAEASLVTWDFSWERTSRSNTYAGTGMFSYDSSAGNNVTHGSSWFGNLADELTAFSFEGFVNNVSIGVTNALPGYFDFSPNLEILWGLSANKFSYSDAAGVGCLFNRCSLYDDGDRYRRSTGRITLTRRNIVIDGDKPPTSLPEPGLFGLTMVGLLLGLWRRRSNVAA